MIPEEAENKFKYLEDDGPNLVKELLSNKRLNSENKFKLFFWILFLHLRNPSYENKMQAEKIQTVISLFQAFLWQVIRDANEYLNRTNNSKKTSGSILEDIKVYEQILEHKWSARLIHSNNPNIITSDNPSIAFQVGEHDYIDFILLPISNSSLLIYADNAKCKIIESVLTSEDIILLNWIQTMHCLKKVYSSKKLNDIKMNKIKQTLSIEDRRQQYEGFISQNGFKNNFLSYPICGKTFSFLEIYDL